MPGESRPQGQSPRDPRFPYHGRVRLLVPFEPWRLLLSLSGLNLSSTGICALLPAPAGGGGRAEAQEAAAREAQEVEALLVEGDPFHLQLEHDSEHLPAPVAQARLVRRQRTALGLALAFAFEPAGSGGSGDSELLGLVHELAQRCARSRT